MSLCQEFAALKQASETYLQTVYDSVSAESEANIQIKTALLALLAKAKQHGSAVISAQISQSIIDYLCTISGHFEDLAVLEAHTPSVLTEAELSYIIEHSALARWF